MKESIRTIAVTTGGTINLPVDLASSAPLLLNKKYRINGSATLASSLNVAAQGTPSTNDVLEVIWEATVVPGANAITICGTVVPTHLAATYFTALCTYDSGKWVVVISPSFVENGIVVAANMGAESVETAALKDGNTTLAKIQDVAANSMLIRDANSSGVLTELTLASTEFPVGTGTGITAVSMSGDATMDNAGVVTLGAKVVEGGMVADGTITNLNLEDNANRYTRDIVLSFENAGEIGNINFTMCQDCELESIVVSVLAAPTTDDATLIFKDNGGAALTGAQIDITTALALGNKVTSTPTANNTFSAGDNLIIEMSKTTAELCKVNVALCLKKN